MVWGTKLKLGELLINGAQQRAERIATSFTSIIYLLLLVITDKVHINNRGFSPKPSQCIK
jgi:hypothetical protein